MRWATTRMRPVLRLFRRDLTTASYISIVWASFGGLPASEIWCGSSTIMASAPCPVMLPLIEAANTPPPAVVAKFIALAWPFLIFVGNMFRYHSAARMERIERAIFSASSSEQARSMIFVLELCPKIQAARQIEPKCVFRYRGGKLQISRLVVPSANAVSLLARYSM